MSLGLLSRYQALKKTKSSNLTPIKAYFSQQSLGENAVVRNKVKRLLREQFRQTESGSPIPMDVVVVARHTAKNASYDDIASSLGKGISKLRKALAEKSGSVEKTAKEIAENAVLKKTDEKNS